MRKPWIAIVMIALAVGLVAMYRAGRAAKTPRDVAAIESPSEPAATEPAPREGKRAARAPEASWPPRGGSEEKLQLAPIKPYYEPKTKPADEPAAVSAPPTPAPFGRAPAARVGSGGVPHGPASKPLSQSPTPQPPPAPPPPAAPPTARPAAADEAAGLSDDADSDRQAPSLESLSFTPPEIQDGGMTVLAVGVSDNLSGVKSVTGTLLSPSEAAVLTFTGHAPEGGGTFSASVNIPRRAETGDWFVGTLLITDRADNPLSLSFRKGNAPQGGLLRVVSSESDSAPPTLRNITVEHGAIGPGEKNLVVVEVEDDRSGVASVTGAFQNRTRTALIPFSGRPRGEPVWAAEVGVPENADCGEWTLRHLMLTDNAKNNVVLDSADPLVGRTGFMVTGGGACDAEPPVVSGMYFTPSVVSNTTGGEITLTVRIQDAGSGVASVFGRIEGPASPAGQVARIPFECTPDPGDPEHQMTAKIPVPQHAARGVWSVIWLHVTDRARNSHPYYKGDPALAGGTFTVE